MFRKLEKLKREMDRCEKAALSFGSDYAGLETEEYSKAVTAYLNYGREYYDDENLTLVELNRLYEKDAKFDGVKVQDYYEQDEAISFLASSVFEEEHFGNAITDAEFTYREGLKNEYATEIEFAKVIVANNPNFESLSYKNKINFVANLLVQLHSKREDEDKIILD